MKKPNLIARLTEALLGPLIDLLDGWKSILGVLVALTAMVLQKFGVIEPATAEEIYTAAKWLFGIGIFHKSVKRTRKT